ncbi:membrane protein [Erythrobacter longus]|uniref:Membrane protein n=1 Tax=Erythrobacter longus TaxID=1044 RepID=A0A074M3K3_ERYLO|nr:TIGR00341 family protein [Erythrobacter longus]KEO89186.1 membrane protein [Erythrobacter longus]
MNLADTVENSGKTEDSSTPPAEEKNATERDPHAVFGKVDSAGEAVRAATQSRYGFKRVLATLRGWWREDVVGTVEQSAVIEKRRAECALSERYLFMTAMSAGIAVLGLLLSSPAVVIGAMLLSPLMDPIMGLGFALAIGDYQWLKKSARSLFWGTIIAVGLTAALVYFSPIQTITPEIAARTQPNLFDLFVALFSALAGAYAMIRGREGTIVGVAIATALMPPLATVGFGLATWNWTVFSGALLLYITNLITIALTALAMARLYGFESSLSARNSLFQNIAVATVFVALAVPLALSLQQIAFQTNSQRIIRAEIEEAYAGSVDIAQLDVDFRADPVLATATVYTPSPKVSAETEIEAALITRLGRPIEFSLREFGVDSGASAAQQAALSAARANEEAAAQQRAETLATRLALVAGVDEDDVTVDRTRRRATVRARELEGATLAAYRVLEMRIARTEPEWVIELLPPAGDLPDSIPFGEEGPTLEGAQALAVIEWAANRTGLPIVLEGREEDATRAAELLGQRGVNVTVQSSSGPVRAKWGGG